MKRLLRGAWKGICAVGFLACFFLLVMLAGAQPGTLITGIVLLGGLYFFAKHLVDD